MDKKSAGSCALVLLTDQGVPRQSVKIVKGITTLGRSPDNDVLLGEFAAPYHAHVVKDASTCTLVSLDSAVAFSVNGEKVKKRVLVDGDIISIGRDKIRFATGGEPPAVSVSAGLDYTHKLYEFSETLMRSESADGLLVSLMDSIIELTRAQTGLLILTEGEGFAVKVARNSRGENLSADKVEMSDTVVSWVLKEKTPLLISDAQKNDSFGRSASIVNLKLRSVMGAPLLVRGKSLGMIYVGNDRAGSLFVRQDMEVLTIFASQAALILDNAALLDDLRMKYDILSRRIEDARFGDLLGTSPAMQKVFRTLDKVASTDIPLLIIGETGVGKWMLCREIHRRSGRTGPLVRLDCAGDSPQILDEELLGAPGKKSFFADAQGGTLILREIASLPLSLQGHALQMVSSPGSCRIIATTSQDLEHERSRLNFRDDLFFGLAHVIIRLPPLRERGDDIELLARYFLGRITEEMKSEKKDFTGEAISVMLRYSWPGNIMELENKVRRAVVLSRGPLLTEEDLEISRSSVGAPVPLGEAKENFARLYVEKALREFHGDKERTAAALGVNVRTIYRYSGKGE